MMANAKNPCWCECDIECTEKYCERDVDCRFKDDLSFEWKRRKPADKGVNP